MSKNAYIESDENIEHLVRSGFLIQDPDDKFIYNLSNSISKRYNIILDSTHSKKTLHKKSPRMNKNKSAFSRLTWGAIVVALFLALVWGIKNLIPGIGPANIAIPSLPPATPSPQTLITPTQTPVTEKLEIISEVDLNCDNYLERISGVLSREIAYFNIYPQYAKIVLETANDTGFEKAWEQSAQGAGVAYLAYQLYTANNCDQFIVVIGHKGNETINVYRWDGVQLTNVLKLSGRFLFEGDWMKDVFGADITSSNSLFLGELQQPGNSSKNIWILREYQWKEGSLHLITEIRKELSGGG